MLYPRAAARRATRGGRQTGGDAMTSTETHTEAMMHPEPQKEHRWLHKLLGEWTCEIEMTMEPGAPAVKSTAADSVRSLGGLWILAEGQGEMPGCGPATSLMTLGYDPQQQRFVGTFVASMMTHLWIYHNGALNAAETA